MKGFWSIIGFVLIMVGFSALALMLIGVQLSFLTWLDAPGRLIGFLLRIAMIIGGIVIIVLTRSNWKDIGIEN